MAMESIGERIRRIRDEKGVSRKELAAAVGMSYSGLSDLESGKAKTTTKLHHIASHLGVDVNHLETGRLSQSQSVELDLEMLKSAIVSVKEALKALGLELDAFLAAPMIAYAYAERASLPRDMSKADYRAFDELITARLKGELGHVQKQGSTSETGSRGVKELAPARKKAGNR